MKSKEAKEKMMKEGSAKKERRRRSALVLSVTVALVMSIGSPISVSFAAEPDGLASYIEKNTEVSEPILNSEDPEGSSELSGLPLPEAETYEEYLNNLSSSGSADKKLKANAAESDNIEWTVTNGNLILSGSGAMRDYSLNNGQTTADWISKKSEITAITIMEGITGIGKDAFAGLENVTEVSFPSSISTIGEAAFYGCKSLPSITIPGTVSVIPRGMLVKCSSLSEIIIEKGVREIEGYAFQKTIADTLRIPSTVREIDPACFYVTNFQKYLVDDNNATFQEEDGILFTDNGATLFAYPEQRKDTYYDVPDHVKKLGEDSFIFNKHITSIDLSGIKTLGSSALSSTTLSGDLYIPDSITEAGDSCFSGCKNLTSVHFGSGLKETSYRMFEECSGLKDIYFHKRQEILGMRTFSRCTSLTEVHVPANITEMQGCFSYCTSLKTFTSDSVETIWYAEFAGNTMLENVTLNNVKEINREAFNSCTSLKSIKLPKSTQFVNETAFPVTTAISCANKELIPYGRNGLQYGDTISISGTRHYDEAYDVLASVNQYRRAEGLQELTMDKGMLEDAMRRAAEGAVLFSHTRPDSSTCFSIDTRLHAENIAIGQSSAKGVMKSWMSSSGHKGNILSDSAKAIGIGCFEIDGLKVWAQCFTFGENNSQIAEASVPAVQNKTETIQIKRDPFEEAPAGAGVEFNFGDSSEYTYSISLEMPSNQLEAGTSFKATATVLNPGYYAYIPVNPQSFNWKSNNTNIAVVDKNGVVAGKSTGTALITASLKYMSAKCNINVGKFSSKLKKNTLQVKANTVRIKYKKLKRHKQTISAGKAYTIRKAKGKTTFKLVRVNKSKYKKYFKVNKKTGKITVRKKLRKGTYKVKVKVTAAGNNKYKTGSKTVTVKIIVK